MTLRQRLTTTISLGLLLSGTLVSAVAAAPQNWTRVFADPSGALYVDNASMKRNGPYRYFWLYGEITNHPRLPENVGGFTMYVSMDCRQRAMRVRAMQMIGKNGEVLREQNLGERGALSQLRTTNRTSNALYKYVCAR